MIGRHLVLSILFPLVLVSCSKPATPGTALYFMEHEPGLDPYRTRIIVTPGFLRMDGGPEDENFLLFDRGDGTIYSVTAADRQILVVAPRPVDAEPPAGLTHRVVRDSAEFPAVAGHAVVHYELMTDGKRCYDLYAADKLLPDAVAALRQYREVLAGQQARMLPAMPREMQSSCDMANHVFKPARHLAHGFPIRLVDMTGRTTELVDYQVDFRVDAAMLRLPADYQRLTIESLRGE